MIAAPSEVEAVSIDALVFALITATSEVLAVVTCESVFAFTSVVTDVEAFCTSVRVASDPLERPAPVSVRVPLVHTSEARVP